jgi:hypothetical protein
MNVQNREPLVDLEKIPNGEDEAIQKIINLEREILKKMNGENLPVPRSQHPKHHGCVRANFIVAKNVPEEFRVGVFAIPGNTFPAWIRFSNARTLDDREKGGHGMAIKLMQVPGEKLLPGQEHGQTQDFLLLDSPTFFIKDAIEFAEFNAARLKSLSARSPQLSLIIGYFLKHPLEFPGLFKIERNYSPNPLATQYWSATPYKLGTGAVKYFVDPRDGDIGSRITGPAESRDRLRVAMKLYLQTRDAYFDFFVQAQMDPSRQPVEDPRRRWETPIQNLATIHIPQQIFDSPAQMDFCDKLSFNPWRSLPDHRPLGSLNRLRKATYVALSEFRHEQNHAPSIEPTPETMPSDSKPAA